MGSARDPGGGETITIERHDALEFVTSVGQVPADRLRKIFDGMFDGVWLVSEDGRTTYANAAMAGLLQSTPEAMRGLAITAFLDPGLWATVTGFLERQRVLSGERMEMRFRRMDGSDLIGIVAGSPIETTSGVFVGTMLNVSDVTAKRAIDAQLIQSQRLEAIGQFAGGIAHDFNNYLAAIRGYTELAIAGLAEDDPIRRDLDRVLACSDRASAVTRKLLAFTRRQALVPVDVDPAVVIAGLLPVLAPLMGRVVTALDVDANHAWVRVDPTQLEQVILNLAVNARDAMPDGGTIRISVHNLASEDPDRPDPDLTAGPFVRISVSDTGPGIDEATKARIFDPFFTTKAEGKGTGFGLSTAFGIVAQAGGQIRVETAPGLGATFHVDLPRVLARTLRTTEPPAAPPVRASGSVLLVEDDPAVREFARRGLAAVGFSVVVAADAEAALDAGRRRDSAIDVIVTDVVMPGMHGPELALELRRTRPGLAVVLMSGYTEDAVGADTELGDVAFLSKPFTLNALVGAVARAARGSASPGSDEPQARAAG